MGHMPRLVLPSASCPSWAALTSLVLTVGACRDHPGPAEPPGNGASAALQALQAPDASDGRAIRDYYLVRFGDDVRDVPGEAQRLSHAHAGRLEYVYERAMRGFSIRVPAAAAEAIARDPRVQSVSPVHAMELTDVQTSPP